MNFQNIKLRHFITVLILGSFLTGCDNAIFSSDGDDGNGKVIAVAEPGPTGPTGPIAENDLVFLSDSFERDDIFEDFINNIIYGWRGMVVENGNPILGFNNTVAGSFIPAAGALGPAADGDRFLLMRGNSTNQTAESVYLVTQSYDLSQYNTAIITFKYLTFGLNDADDTLPESLELQVCRGTLNECGANDDALDPNGLLSNNWVTVFVSDDSVSDDIFNGQNHNAGDWRTGITVVDLKNPDFVGDGSTFVMRFVGKMKDGSTVVVTPPDCDDECDDDCDGDCDDDHDRDCDHDCEKNCKHKKCNHQKNCKHEKCSHKKDCANNKKCKHEKCDHKKNCKHEKCNHKKDCASKKNCKHEKCSHKKDCASKKNCKHEKCNHKKSNCKKQNCCKCEGKDEPGTPTTDPSTIQDGIGIDAVQGIASPRTIDEIF